VESVRSFAIYVEPWHADIYEFLTEEKPWKEEMRARGLIYCHVDLPDLFMKR